MSLLSNIRSQPEKTRRVIFILLSVITVTVVGTLWVGKIKRDLFALLNPNVEDQRAFAEAQQVSHTGPIGFLERGIEKMQAMMGGLFSQEITKPSASPAVSGNPLLLPLPKSK
jgi:hypothetical protein